MIMLVHVGTILNDHFSNNHLNDLVSNRFIMLVSNCWNDHVSRDQPCPEF